MGLIKITVSMMMAALFAIALITFGANFASDNEATVSIGDDPDVSSVLTKVTGDINKFDVEGEDIADAYVKTTTDTTDESTSGGTQFKVTVWTSLAKAKNVVTLAWNKIFGNGSEFNILFVALFSILTFIGINYAYRAFLGKEP